MYLRNEVVVLVQKCLRNEGILGAIEDDRTAAVNLNCVITAQWSDRPIYLYRGTYFIIRTAGLRGVYVRPSP